MYKILGKTVEHILVGLRNSCCSTWCSIMFYIYIPKFAEMKSFLQFSVSTVPDHDNLELWLKVYIPAFCYSAFILCTLGILQVNSLFPTNQSSLDVFSSQVDDEIRQKGSTKDMIFKIPYLISHISSIMTLFEGDTILTG